MDNVKKSVGILLPAMRISFALALLTGCLFLAADFLGFVPKESKFILAERKKISEALAHTILNLRSGSRPKKHTKNVRAYRKTYPGN